MEGLDMNEGFWAQMQEGLSDEDDIVPTFDLTSTYLLSYFKPQVSCAATVWKR